jgi:hypothetical protein
MIAVLVGHHDRGQTRQVERQFRRALLQAPHR